MKKTYKYIFSAALLSLTLGSVAACGKSKSSSTKDRLYIVYYPGGYGKEYLETFAREFVAEYKNKPVDQVVAGEDYYLKGDPNAHFSTDAYLSLKDKAPDVIIAGSPASEAISLGKIEPLTDLYEQTVTVTENGAQVEKKIKDYYDEEATLQYKRQYIYTKGNEEYFAIPWDKIPLSFAYNENILLNTTHVAASGEVGEARLSEGKWVAAPETYDELITFFNDIEAANATREKKITPFAWCSANANWFETLYISWWAESQGLYSSLKSSDPSNIDSKCFYDFWNRESPELYKMSGIQDALQKVKDLIYDENHHFKYTYVDKDPTTITGQWSQADFALGNAAVCLTGNFFEKEYAPQIEESKQTFKMMSLPTINRLAGLKNANGEQINQMCYVNCDASAYIPFNSPNKDMAKAFLRYVSQEKQAVRFTEMTGGFKPVKTNVKAISTKTDWTPFQQSILNVLYDADEVIYKFPKTKTSPLSPIYVYENELRAAFFTGLSFPLSISRLANYTPYEIMVDMPNNTGDSVYEAAVKMYTNSTTGFNKVYASWINSQK